MMEYSKEQKSVLNIYALLCVSLIMSFIPLAQTAFLATLMFAAALAGAYAVRRKSGPESLSATHMTFIIRTIWITSLFAFITTSMASVYVLSLYDPGPLQSCANAWISGMTAQDDAMKFAVDTIMPCVNDFITANVHVFAAGGMIAATPVVIYVAFRLARGLSRALKGHRIGNVKSWF